VRRGGIVVLAVLAASCERCSSCKDKAKAYLTQPPLEEYQREVEEQIPTASRQATSMCGFPVAGLKDAKVTIAQQDPKRFRVEGKPIAKGDASIDEAKAALCIGTMSVIAWPIVDDDNKVTGFKWDPIVLETVETPGVKWTKPSGGGGGWD
jgi:hypothetical protein